MSMHESRTVTRGWVRAVATDGNARRRLRWGGGPNLMCCADVLAWLDHKPRTTALQLQVDNTLTANPYEKFPTRHSLNFCGCRWLVGC